MKRPTYRMERVRIADCRPHADAEAYSASSEDRAALSNSIEPMSMREFSRLIRRSPSHISRVMNGKRASATISRLMKTLGVEEA